MAGLATHIAVTNGQQKAAAGPTQSPWHGTIININRGKSTIDVRREGFVRTIHYNSSTKLTEDKKLVDMSELKEGMDVICLGNYPSGSVVMNATRTDLRRR